MDLHDALAYLDDHANLERLVAPSATPSLDRMRTLVAALGDPQRDYPIVHLTGTNGKGSVARMVTTLLAASGITTGTFTSPHLQAVNERIRRNGEPIHDDDLADAIAAVALAEQSEGVRPNYFEILAAAAFRHFSDEAVEVAVVEVGLGGRWDATNVGDAAVAVVTNVGIDHVEYLGPDRTSIATEKAGIVKPGSLLVLGEIDDEVAPIFEAAGAREVWRRERDFACDRSALAVGGRVVTLRTPGATYEDVVLPAHGAHQALNASVALAAVEGLLGAPLGDDVVRDGFTALRLPGRFEIGGRKPLVVLDGAHNPHGCLALAATLEEEFSVDRRVWVLGMLGTEADPRIEALGISAGTDHAVVCCAPDSPRALPSAEVAAAVRRRGVEAVVEDDLSLAIERARALAGEQGGVVVAGSLYLVGAARTVLDLEPA